MTDLRRSDLIAELSKIEEQLGNKRDLRSAINHAVSALQTENEGHVKISNKDQIVDTVLSIEGQLEILEEETKRSEKSAKLTALTAALASLASGIFSALSADVAATFSSLRLILLISEDLLPFLGLLAAGISVRFMFIKIKRGNEYSSLREATQKLHSYISSFV